MSATGACTHREVWLLLPWLANGRLDPAERLRVEQHVRGCPDCAREVQLQRLVCDALTEPERVTYAPGPSLRKLMERIDARSGAAARADEPARPGLTRAARLRAAWRPPGLAWAASFVLAVGLTALAATAYRWSEPLYITRTETPPASAALLNVAFDRALSVGEVQEVLHGAGARVVEGPDGTGIFAVAPLARPGTGADTAAALRALALRLRADARVRWVQPLPGSAQVSRAERPPSRGP
jgi:hypothetical protein